MGTFSNAALNYTAGKKFGNQLMLPVAGVRGNVGGSLGSRGGSGRYWSSTENGNVNAGILIFSSSGATTNDSTRSFGLSVRCVAE